MSKLSTHAHAAKLIRQELKKHGIKARVRSKCYAGGNSVDVDVEDLAPWTVKAIESFVGQFQYGHFDGMFDIYEHSNRRDDLPQVKFAFVGCDYSDEMRQAAYEYLRDHFHGYADHPELYEEAKNLRGCSEWVSTEVHQVLGGVLGSFWKKPRVRLEAAMEEAA